MAWISVSATRHQFSSRVAEDRTARLNSGIVEFNVQNMVAAWIGGDAETIREEADILMHPKHLPPKMLAHPPEFLVGTLAASFLLKRCAGEAVDSELKRLSQLKGYKETGARVVQGILQRILSGEKAKSSPRQIGYPETEPKFLKLAERYAPPIPLQITLVPDGPFWGRQFVAVVPLAYETLLAAGVVPDADRLGAIVRAGGAEERREVVYERVSGVPGVWRDDPTEVPGFDVVELTADSVVVHHYMGVRWQAPLLFDKDVNAFHFLEHVDAGWKQVQASVGKEAWTRLTKARAERRTVHRVSIDAVNAMEDPASTERARQRYSVEIEVVDFLRA